MLWRATQVKTTITRRARRAITPKGVKIDPRDRALYSRLTPGFKTFPPGRTARGRYRYAVNYELFIDSGRV